MQTEYPTHQPYADAATDTLYHMLFGDRPQDFATQPGAQPEPWQAALCATPSDLRVAAQIAADREAEPRVRLLACRLLGAHGAQVPGRELLGVVVEVPIGAEGLDTLAAYVDGSVRYINHTGRVQIVEPLPATLPLVKRLVESSVAVVSRIGPWNGVRRGVPPAGHVRLNFLVTDGLYFGEGDMRVLQRDAMAGPIIDAATALLQCVAGLATRRAA